MKRAKQRFQSRERSIEARAAMWAKGLERFNEENPNFVGIEKIIVPTERDKEQVILALRYLHDCFIDTDYPAVNTLVHFYLNPENIEVSNDN
ncbi:MAG TPA: hypothetical protein VFM18_18145 [Methanosarcina sp.]|nr:hypothetical protein [Methanosarcina sp.]